MFKFSCSMMCGHIIHFFFSLFLTLFACLFILKSPNDDDGDDDDGDGHLKSMEKPMLKVNSGFNKREM